MRHGRGFVNDQPFHLMKHRRMGGVVIAAVSAAGSNNANRRLLVFHGADLYRRSMGAHDITVVKIRTVGVGNVEGVLHLARRVVGRHVKRVEVVELVFNVRPFGNFKAHLAEDGNHFLVNFRHRMNPSLGFRPHRQSNVDALTGQTAVQFNRFQFAFAAFDGVFHCRFQQVQRLAGGDFLFRRQGAQRFHLFGNAAFFAESGHPEFVQFLQPGGRTDAGQQFFL